MGLQGTLHQAVAQHGAKPMLSRAWLVSQGTGLLKSGLGEADEISVAFQGFLESPTQLRGTKIGEDVSTL